ncbi:TRAP transporter substrate-binding protein [Mesorhizobium newzealandense]|uniref:TRAP transporter substrate-binding protein n=3 Tax=Mesorhizobium TaxID=68287 RepID=A0ABW4WBH0_9HYPH|nr:TRAP transporter substrate-binding protein [Mesorhizobium sophorae]
MAGMSLAIKGGLSMQTMSRRNVLKLGGIAIASPFIIRNARAAEFNYKLGLELRDDQPLPKRMLEAAATIAEETNGRLQIQGFPNGALGNPVETLNQVRSGALEFLTSSFGILSTLDRRAGLPTLGFIFENYDQVWKAIDGDLGKYVAKVIAEHGELAVVDGIHDIGFRHVTSNNGLFAQPADLKGVRIRTPPTPFLTSLFSALGASPTPIAFGDLYSALQTGTVDAQENPLTVVASYKFYEVQKFCTLTSHTWDGWVPVANRAAWERLPEDIRQVVARNFQKAALQQRKDIATQVAAVRTDLDQKGLQFGSPGPGVYRKTLQGTQFYSDWKKQIGAEAWGVLEGAVGKLG